LGATIRALNGTPLLSKAGMVARLADVHGGQLVTFSIEGPPPSALARAPPADHDGREGSRSDRMLLYLRSTRMDADGMYHLLVIVHTIIRTRD
jgi:hypothetical protein